MKPKVKETEKSRILMTRDYSMFEFPDVQISKKFLQLIKDSISEKNLMPDFPILVDESYHILDGKYKFLACYDLKLPVYYKVAEVTNITDAVRLKEISKKTPLKQIIQIYKDKEGYANLAHIHEFFKGGFRYQDIICCIDGMTKNKPLNIWDMASRLTYDRYKVAAGRLTEYDVNSIIKRLTTCKYLMEEFGLPSDAAVAMLFAWNYTIEFEVEGKSFRQAKNLSEATHNGFIWEYRLLKAYTLKMSEAERTEWVNQRIEEWRDYRQAAV